MSNLEAIFRSETSSRTAEYTEHTPRGLVRSPSPPAGRRSRAGERRAPQKSAPLPAPPSGYLFSVILLMFSLCRRLRRSLRRRVHGSTKGRSLPVDAKHVPGRGKGG